MSGGVPRRERVQRRLAAGMAVALMVGAPAGMAAAAAPAARDVRAQAAEPADLDLASQTPWVEPDGELALRLRVLDDDGRPLAVPPASPLDDGGGGAGAAGGGEDVPVIAIEIHERITSRSAFVRTLDGEGLGTTVTRTSAPLDRLGRDATGSVVVRLGVASGTGTSEPGGPPRIVLRLEGVYPLRIELRQGSEVVDELVTHLIRVPAGDDIAPLRSALVVPLHAPPSIGPDGIRRVNPADRRRIDELVGALTASPPGTVTVAPTPETVAGLAAGGDDDSALLDRLRDLAEHHDVLAGPYVPVDPLGLVESGLDDELGEQLTRGAETLAEHLDARPPVRTWLAATPLDAAALGALRTHGIDQVVADEVLLTPMPLRVTLTQPFELEDSRGRALLGLQADAQLASHLAGGEDPVLSAHHFLADLAVLFFDQPALERGVATVTPAEWSPDARLVETVLAGLATSPIVAPASIDAIFAEAEPVTDDGEPVVRDLVDVDAVGSGDAEALAGLRARVESFASMVAPTNPALAMARELLLVSQSVDLTGTQRSRYLRAAAAGLEGQLSLIEFPRRRTITLTARTGQVPVTLRNGTGQPVDVVLQLNSDKLDFPGGSTRRLQLPGGNTTTQFRVEARTSGTFPLRVTVLSPDGATLLGSSRYTIRSTAVSGVGLFLTGGALAFLVVWWGLHLHRNRPGKTPRS